MTSGLFKNSIVLLTKYREDSSLTSQQKHSLSEVIVRLKTASEKYSEIVELNTSLLETDPVLAEIRETMSEENVNNIMQEQAKKDPALAAYLKSIGGRLVSVQSTELSSYDLSDIDSRRPDQAQQIKRLHVATEFFYENLWTVKTRLNELPRFKQFNPVGVRDVRNHLIAHTRSKSSEAYIFSFGVATNGPVLRPTKPAGAKAPADRGFEVNVAEFVNSVISVLERTFGSSL